MNIKKREDIEWKNEWIQNANDENKKRWIVVGDSVQRMFRSGLQSVLDSDYAIDYLGSSFQVDDERYLEGIDTFIIDGEYRYEKAIVTIGGHHGLDAEKKDNITDIKIWSNWCKKIIRRIGESIESVDIISINPETNQRDISSFKTPRNQLIEERNGQLCRIAANEGYEYIDIYNVIRRYRDFFLYYDRKHFYQEAVDALMSKIYKNNFECNCFGKTRIIRNVKELLYLAKKKERVFIYGAGNHGNEMKVFLKFFGINSEGFVISDGEKNTFRDTIYFSELEYRENFDLIIIAMERPVSELFPIDRDIVVHKPVRAVLDWIAEYINLVG